MNAECEEHTGTPICQLLVHWHDKGGEKLSDKDFDTVLKHFKDKGAKLDGKMVVHHAGLDTKDSKIKFGMLDLPLSMKRIDCAKTLVEIIGGRGVTGWFSWLLALLLFLQLFGSLFSFLLGCLLVRGPVGGYRLVALNSQHL